MRVLESTLYLISLIVTALFSLALTATLTSGMLTSLAGMLSALFVDIVTTVFMWLQLLMLINSAPSRKELFSLRRMSATWRLTLARTAILIADAAARPPPSTGESPTPASASDSGQDSTQSSLRRIGTRSCPSIVNTEKGGEPTLSFQLDDSSESREESPSLDAPSSPSQRFDPYSTLATL